MAADTQGLEPKDYDADRLHQSVQRAAHEPLDAAAIAGIEQRLTAAMHRYLADVHSGRIDPQQLPHGYAAPGRAPFDAVATLQAALASGRLEGAARDVAPRIP